MKHIKRIFEFVSSDDSKVIDAKMEELIDVISTHDDTYLNWEFNDKMLDVILRVGENVHQYNVDLNYMTIREYKNGRVVDKIYCAEGGIDEILDMMEKSIYSSLGVYEMKKYKK